MGLRAREVRRGWSRRGKGDVEDWDRIRSIKHAKKLGGKILTDLTWMDGFLKTDDDDDDTSRATFKIDQSTQGGFFFFWKKKKNQICFFFSNEGFSGSVLWKLLTISITRKKSPPPPKKKKKEQKRQRQRERMEKDTTLVRWMCRWDRSPMGSTDDDDEEEWVGGWWSTGKLESSQHTLLIIVAQQQIKTKGKLEERGGDKPSIKERLGGGGGGRERERGDGIKRTDVPDDSGQECWTWEATSNRWEGERLSDNDEGYRRGSVNWAREWGECNISKVIDRSN